MLQRMSETELYIMEQLWKFARAVSAKELEQYFMTDKGWKIQTVSTFLTRMERKKVLKTFKKGRTKMYQPAFTKEEYRTVEAQGVLDDFYQGSLKNFFVALYGERLPSEKVEELEAWLNEQKEGK